MQVSTLKMSRSSMKLLTAASIVLFGISFSYSANAFGTEHANLGKSPYKKALKHDARMERETARDAKRKPAKILELLELKEGMRVADLGAGFGYYTDLISQVVGPTGTVITHNVPYIINKFDTTFGEGGPWQQRLSSTAWQTNVVSQISKMEDFKVDKPIDAALLVLFYHDVVWMDEDREKMNKAIYQALKPGGVFLIIDHSAKQGAGVSTVETFHRIDKQLVIDEVTAAGFKFVEEFDFLANPADTRDFNVFRDYSTSRDATDRFVLKFRR
jgi:predicted methyltransferase